MTSRTAEIKKFIPLAPGIPEDDAIEAYQRDGVVCLRSAFSDEWIEGLEHKPKGDWTANEATGYAKHCLFK